MRQDCELEDIVEALSAEVPSPHAMRAVRAYERPEQIAEPLDPEQDLAALESVLLVCSTCSVVSVLMFAAVYTRIS